MAYTKGSGSGFRAKGIRKAVRSQMKDRGGRARITSQLARTSGVRKKAAHKRKKGH